MNNENDSLKKQFEIFVNECKFFRGLRTETIRGYRACFDTLMKIVPELTLDSLNYDSMILFFERLNKRERLVGKKKFRTGIKTSTIATYRSKLNAFFLWLVKKKVIEQNPMDSIPYPSVRYEDKRWLDKKDLDKIFAAILMNMNRLNPFLKKRNMAIATTFLYSGLRRNELLNLKVFDVNMEKQHIHVNGSTSKSKRDREVPISKELSGFLQDYIEERQKRTFKSEYFFISEKDERFTEHGLKHLVEEIEEASGIKFHVHQFRHTFAVNLLGKTENFPVVQQLLGHVDPKMTLAYLRCLPSKMKKKEVDSLSFDTFFDTLSLIRQTLDKWA